MPPIGWNSSPGTFSCSYSGPMGGFAEPFLKKKEVALLISGASPSEENIDKAYEILKQLQCTMIAFTQLVMFRLLIRN